ncbi:MAG: hypothetical protein P4L98_18370 [Ancalomicrobiaceae bacterium]|nr:hypothetical protein [Ancalomicrobiaceae bacterium]
MRISHWVAFGSWSRGPGAWSGLRRMCGAALAVGLLVAARPAGAVETFSARDLIKGTTVTAAQCARNSHAVFVSVLGEGVCIRYYTGGEALSGRQAIVFFNGDVLETDGHGNLVAEPGYLTGAPEFLDIGVRAWARRFGVPVIFFARMGMHGSSGWHGNRRTRLEIEVTRTALDLIKANEGVAGFHVVGQSGGGILAAAVAASRDDVGCAVIASAPLDFALFAKTAGITVRRDGKRAHWDPSGDVSALAAKPDLRLIVMNDPADTIVPPQAEANFIDKLRAAGKPVLHIETAARGVEHHSLTEKALFSAGLCTTGAPDATIDSIYGHTGPDDLPK